MPHGILKTLNLVAMLDEIAHHLITCLDLLLVFQRQAQPAAHQSSAHRRNGLVDDVNQSLGIQVGRVKQFQIADGELVQPHILSLVEARQGSDMA